MGQILVLDSVIIQPMQMGLALLKDWHNLPDNKMIEENLRRVLKSTRKHRRCLVKSKTRYTRLHNKLKTFLTSTELLAYKGSNSLKRYTTHPKLNTFYDRIVTEVNNNPNFSVQEAAVDTLPSTSGEEGETITRISPKQDLGSSMASTVNNLYTDDALINNFEQLSEKPEKLFGNIESPLRKSLYIERDIKISEVKDILRRVNTCLAGTNDEFTSSSFTVCGFPKESLDLFKSDFKVLFEIFDECDVTRILHYSSFSKMNINYKNEFIIFEASFEKAPEEWCIVYILINIVNLDDKYKYNVFVTSNFTQLTLITHYYVCSMFPKYHDIRRTVEYGFFKRYFTRFERLKDLQSGVDRENIISFKIDCRPISNKKRKYSELEGNAIKALIELPESDSEFADELDL
ncbi:unnamed protein product [Rotaria magnacalcarata]|uniref:Uncharacterized protein n=1 Tax=Rotaria magnacalcarata TaxID=392030 RepID=A0A816NHQ3_9BILA|nr:unnamed protein product [Rotaria magnacalcarata]